MLGSKYNSHQKPETPARKFFETKRIPAKRKIYRKRS